MEESTAGLRALSCSLVTTLKVSTPSSKPVPVKLRIKKTTAYPIKPSDAITIRTEPVRTAELSCAMLSSPFYHCSLGHTVESFACHSAICCPYLFPRETRNPSEEGLRLERTCVPIHVLHFTWTTYKTIAVLPMFLAV